MADNEVAQPSFDAEAFGGEDISGDGGIYKKISKAGNPAAGTPPKGSHVRVHYVGTLLDGTKFDSSRDRPGFFEFDVGVGQVIKGWDTGIMTMHKGEVATLVCRADYAYGENGSPPTIPGGATLKFEVELFSWKEKPKPKHTLSNAERLQEAETAKAKGTAQFKLSDFEGALDMYELAADYVQDFEPSEQEADAKALLLTSLSNAAMCSLKLKQYSGAVDLCTRALAVDESSVKALFRRGTAHTALGDFEGAKSDLKKASALDPQNKEIRDAHAECLKKESALKNKEKAMFGKMFA